MRARLRLAYATRAEPCRLHVRARATGVRSLHSREKGTHLVDELVGIDELTESLRMGASECFRVGHDCCALTICASYWRQVATLTGQPLRVGQLQRHCRGELYCCLPPRRRLSSRPASNLVAY